MEAGTDWESIEPRTGFAAWRRRGLVPGADLDLELERGTVGIRWRLIVGGFDALRGVKLGKPGEAFAEAAKAAERFCRTCGRRRVPEDEREVLRLVASVSGAQSRAAWSRWAERFCACSGPVLASRVEVSAAS